MPLPRAVARLNARYTNRFIEPLVARLPGFVVVVHTGRVSGTSYRTPVYAFGSANDLIVALTYGPGADWAQNVLTGGGIIERADDRRAITSSTIVHRPAAWSRLPLIVRGALRVLRVTDFLHLHVG